MGDLLDRRAFLQRAVTCCSGLGVLMTLPSCVSSRNRVSEPVQSTIGCGGGSGGQDITVIGVGCGGGNAVDAMIAAGIEGMKCVAVNTDDQSLSKSLAKHKLLLGAQLTNGRGTGGNPKIGGMAAEAASMGIAAMIRKSDLLFVVAGLGGGTGSGASPVIANLARNMGILTVGVVTTPFPFDGYRRSQQAQESLGKLGTMLDSTIVVRNADLMATLGADTTLQEAFRIGDGMMRLAVSGISDLVSCQGPVAIDFDNLQTIVKRMRRATIGVGVARGRNRAIAAMQQAIGSPLLGAVAIEKATGVILNVTGGPDVSPYEACEAARVLEKTVAPGASFRYGLVTKPEQYGTLTATLIAGR